MGTGGHGLREQRLPNERASMYLMPTQLYLCLGGSCCGEGEEEEIRARPFGSTARWLRGRLLDELRDAGQGGVIIRGARGEHPAAAVTATIRQLCVEGLAERVATATYRLPRRK
ncbi:MAG: hypothetical protein ACKN9G_05045 [Candidatus Limnocylindrus sp.]